jgi:hypothetical protein
MSTLKVNNIQDTSGGDTTLVSATNTAKVWLLYDHLNATILNHYNVSSVDDNATGSMDINFVTALPSANYAVATSGSVQDNTTSAGHVADTNTTVYTTTALRLHIYNTSGSFKDCQRVGVVIYGD